MDARFRQKHVKEEHQTVLGPIGLLMMSIEY